MNVMAAVCVFDVYICLVFVLNVFVPVAAGSPSAGPRTLCVVANGAGRLAHCHCGVRLRAFVTHRPLECSLPHTSLDRRLL